MLHNVEENTLQSLETFSLQTTLSFIHQMLFASGTYKYLSYIIIFQYLILYLIKVPGHGSIMLEFDHLDFHPTDFLEIREGLTDQDSYIATIFGNQTGQQLKEFYLI